MDTIKSENTEEISTSEETRGGIKGLEKNSHVTNEEFEECRERRSRNRTEKGLEFDLEIGTKKRERSMRDLRSRVGTIYESLREPADLVKLNTFKDSLETDLNAFQAAQENVTDLLIRLELPHREQLIHDEFLGVNNAALECLADIKVRIQDQEMERAELISQKSLRSRKSSSSTTSSRRAAIETAKIKAKLDTLKRRQEIEKRRDELKFQEKELERLDEREELHGELSAAEAIQRILQESEFNDTIALREATENSLEQTKKQGISDPKPVGQPQAERIAREEIEEKYIKVNDPIVARTPKQSPGTSENFANTSAGTSPHLPSRLGVDTPLVHRETNQSSRRTESSEQHYNSQIWRIQEENAEIQKTQVELLRRMTVPVPKPPVFDGNILEYPKWENAFDALIEDQVVRPNYKLYYLGEYTRGAAQKTISGLLGLRTEDAYKRARKTLKERFGDPFRIYEAYRDKLRNWTPCVTSADLQEFSDFLIMTQETMKSVKYLKELESYSTIRELAARLPTFYGNKWRESAKKLEAKCGEYSFANFVEFTQEASLDANHPVFSHDALNLARKELEKDKSPPGGSVKRSPERRDKKKRHGISLNTTGSESLCKDPPEASSCVLCKGKHGLATCKNFLATPFKERLEICMSRGICFSCLSQGHTARQCKQKIQCEVCKKPHATALHRFPPVEKGQESTQETVRATNNCVNCSDTTTSMILPVWIHHKNDPNRRVKAYAVLDDQSDTCFVTDDAINELGVTGPVIKLELGTMHAIEKIDTQRIDGLVVSRFDGKVDIPLPKVYTRTHIPGQRGQIPRPETARKYKHLEKIADEISPYEEHLGIGLLIGNNCVRALKPKSIVPGKSNAPYAIRTTLGWGVVGARNHGDHDNEIEMTAGCHRIATREIASNEASTGKFIPLTSCKEIMAPSAIKKMFEQDFSEPLDWNVAMSQEDLKFMSITSNGIHKADDGHYEIPLPLRDESVHLPCNKKRAEARLKQLSRKFAIDSKYKEDYVTFMQKMLEDGHAEKAPKQHETVWYIPHHGVYHPKKPDKLRVVFDCSADFQGHSLNRNLLQGPDLTNSLVGVLCRFRQEPVAFACDIEGMFHQVHVNEEHRDLLRFLWWEQGDTSKEPTEYRMTVHLFGATSSPGCANLALRTAADDGVDEFGIETASFIKENFYVDDGLKSVPTVQEAIELIKNSTEMCMRGGFRLHKFTSNSKEVVESTPIESRAKEIKELDLNRDLLPPERVLGVEWNIVNDAFKFRISLKDKPLTRRGILSTVSSIYDPLGFAAPFLLRGKRILQLLCKESISWDDTIPEELRMQWEMWRNELPLLEIMEVPRCFKLKEMEDLKKVELHHFSDASTEGYGQCSYLRLVDSRNRANCSLVMGKARVTPLKPITIPRLELTAALVSVRVSDMLSRELRYDKVEEVFWTDSKVVQAYIYNDARRFHTFVANRVQQIRERTVPEQWKYVDGKNNPADDASRGLSPKDLLQPSRWLQGPSFLWDHHDSWKNLDKSEPELLQADDKEVRKASSFITCMTNKEQFATLHQRLEYFSSWFRAKRSVAMCLRYRKILLERTRGKQAGVDGAKTRSRTHEYHPVDVNELKEAEQEIIRNVQKEAFKEEIGKLKKITADYETHKEDDSRSRVPKPRGDSPLSRLDPFLDHNNLVRIGGRIKQASISQDVKHPIVLPGQGHVSKLLARHYHERALHQGKGITLNEIRSSGYWIIGGGSVVSRLVHECVACRRLRAKVQEQKMADLPADRLTPTPPFTYCAVDYFGPWYVREGRKELKRYGVLFTCLATRAIHLEVANSLETDSYINALRRFICRRGPVRQMRSDNGSNFIGARRELKEALAEMDQNQVKQDMLKKGCDWFEVKLNVPTASHMGGVWERQIRTVRSVLSALLEKNGHQMNDEALRTFMCEAEAVVNSRPLTGEGTTTSDTAEPLTPNHFLTLKTKVVLPPPGKFTSADLYSRKWWRRVQHLTNEFWSRWKKEFLLSLQTRQKWTRPRKNLQVNDVVIVKDNDTPRNQWKLCRVIEAQADQDGLVRKVMLDVGSPNLTSDGKRNQPLSTLERPIHKLVLLMSQDK